MTVSETTSSKSPPQYAALPKSTPILVVEDSAIQAKALLKIFGELGYKNVVHIDQPEKTLETAKTQKTRLIICDWNMPTLSGLDVLKLIRSDPDLNTLPFLFLTASGDREHVVEAVRSGANDYIVKPASAPIIEEKLRKAGGVLLSCKT